MTSLVLSPNASGSGSLTIAAPNTSSNITFNLPTTIGNAGTSALVTTDASGNLGLGVTPSASSAKTLEIGFAGSTVIGRAVNTTDYTQGAYYNGGWKYANSTYAAAVYEQQAGAHYWLTAPSGTAGNAISFTQAMTLTNDGNNTINSLVGQIRSSINLQGNFNGSTDIGNINFVNAYPITVANIYALTSSATASANGTLVFRTANAGSITEAARITSGGDLLVGKTASDTATAGAELRSNGLVAGTVSGSHAYYANRNTSDGNIFVFERGSVTVGTISVTGSATAYNTSSDYRLKDNPQPLTNSGAFIDALQPKTWEWKTDGSKGVGFIAHEVQAVSPASVVGEKDAVDADGKPVMQAMEYGSAEFIANIIAELQSLRARLAAAGI